MFDVEVNLVAVLIAGILNMVIGAGWYGFFAKPWMALTGKTEEDVKGANMGPVYVTNTVLSLIMAYVLAHVAVWSGANTLLTGLEAGAWMWLGFVGTTFLVNTLYGHGKLKLFAIDSGYYLVSLPLQGMVLALLR